RALPGDGNEMLGIIQPYRAVAAHNLREKARRTAGATAEINGQARLTGNRALKEGPARFGKYGGENRQPPRRDIGITEGVSHFVSIPLPPRQSFSPVPDLCDPEMPRQGWRHPPHPGGPARWRRRHSPASAPPPG